MFTIMKRLACFIRPGTLVDLREVNATLYKFIRLGGNNNLLSIKQRLKIMCFGKVKHISKEQNRTERKVINSQNRKKCHKFFNGY